MSDVKSERVKYLEKLSKKELIYKLTQLEKNDHRELINGHEHTAPKRPGQRKFNFDKSNRRHIVLRVCYLGWNYHGFASQEDTSSTIENFLFNALTKTCLIESRQTSNYHRCGRTDKGVSGFFQAISLDVRSRFSADEQLTEKGLSNELDYCKMLNRLLPQEIRCIAWMPVNDNNFSARFNCLKRTYRYFFPKGNLNIEAMRSACKMLIGTHDFRNFCKMDVNNGVLSYMRSIYDTDIHISQESKCSDFDMYYMELTGKAFLWHQVRCIMAVLILIGQERESPEVIIDLLDVEKNPCKPQYSLASDIPLCLYNCEFGYDQDTNAENDEATNAENNKKMFKWIYSEEHLDRTIKELQSQWTLKSVKCTMISEIIADLSKVYENDLPNTKKIQIQPEILVQGVRAKEYKKLLVRDTCKSLENRIEHVAKKRKLE